MIPKRVLERELLAFQPTLFLSLTLELALLENSQFGNKVLYKQLNLLYFN